MAIPLLAAAGIAAVPGLINSGLKFFGGNKQIKKGEEIDRNNKFIKYQRPSEVVQALKLAEKNYLSGMPGVDILQNRIGTNAATAMNTATQGASSSADVLDAATKINYTTNMANEDLALEEQNFKQDALGGYLNQLGNNSGYADKEFSYNIDQPYQRRAAAASALIGAGHQNKWAGIDEGLGVATDILRTGLKMPPKDGTNPALMGKYVTDPATGLKRWIQ